MPKKTKAKKATTKSGGRNKNAPVQKKKEEKKDDAKFSVEDILTRAQSCIDVYDYDMAQRYCQKALEMDNENVTVLELTGHVMMEVGNLEAAKQCYGRCVELEPESGHLKYLYLGQMMNGMDAVNCYRKAIQVMLNSIEAQENIPATDDVPSEAEAAGDDKSKHTESATSEPSCKDVSSAYLSIAELYMTDLCDEEDAEDQCIGSIKKAIEHDETNPEGYQVLADYHLIKSELEEAKTNIKKSISLWLPNARQLVAPEVEGSQGQGDVCDPVDCLPITPESQIKAAKTLIEVEEYNEATEVLELLLDQDDTVVDVWYLLGWANYLQGDEYKQTAKYYLERSKEVSVKTKYEDTDVVSHIDELLEELSSLPPQDEDDENDIEDLDREEEDMDAD